MSITRRYIIGGALSAIAVGGASYLGFLGATGVRDPLTVQFTRGAALAPGEAERVSAFVGAHIAEPRLVFHVLGHTGQRGDGDANLALSRQRAEAVADLLTEAGVESARIVAVEGAGSADPLARQANETDGALQRRMSRAVITPVLSK